MTAILNAPAKKIQLDSQQTLIRQRLRGYSHNHALMFQSADAATTAISDMLQQIRLDSRQK